MKSDSNVRYEFVDGKYGKGLKINTSGNFYMPDEIFHKLLLSDELTVDCYSCSLASMHRSEVCLACRSDLQNHQSAIRGFQYHNSCHMWIEYNQAHSAAGMPEIDALNLNQWYHMAITKKNDDFKLWLDGKLFYTINRHVTTINDTQVKNVIFGVDSSIISHLRISDIALWDNNFTPPDWGKIDFLNSNL